MHVEQDDVGLSRARSATASSTAAGLGDDVDEPLELRAHAGPEQAVVVDDHDARRLISTSSTSVPSPGPECDAARPPWRSMRPTIDSRTPRRSSGTAASRSPARGRARRPQRSASISAYSGIGASAANLAALLSASRAAATSASSALVERRSRRP